MILAWEWCHCLCFFAFFFLFGGHGRLGGKCGVGPYPQESGARGMRRRGTPVCHAAAMPEGVSLGWGQSERCHWAPLPQNPSFIHIFGSTHNHFSPLASCAQGCRRTIFLFNLKREENPPFWLMQIHSALITNLPRSRRPGEMARFHRSNI